MRSKSEAQIRQWALEFGDEPYDLTSGPLYRFCLIGAGENDQRLLCAFHHLIIDGGSWNIFFHDLVDAMEHKPAPPLTDYFVRCREQRQSIASGNYAQALEFWERRAGGSTASWRLPFSGTAEAELKGKDLVHRRALSSETSALLKASCESLGASPFRILLAAFIGYFRNIRGCSELGVSTTLKGRADPRFDSVVGYFVNNGLVRADNPADSTLRHLLKSACQELDDLVRFEWFPSTLAIRNLRREHDASQLPYTPISLVWSPHLMARQSGQLRITHERLILPRADRDLSVYIERIDNEMALSWVAKENVISAASLARAAASYEDSLTLMLRHPDQSISELRRMTRKELMAVLAAGQGEARDFPLSRRIEALFADQVQVRPHQPALICDDQHWTYLALANAANALEKQLREYGVQGGDWVPLSLPSSAALLIAELSVMRIGAAFIPIDPHWPQRRAEKILSGVPFKVMIAEADKVSRYRESGIACISIRNACPSAEDKPPFLQRDSEPPCDQPMYCLFTSGSTGTPKGAINIQSGILNRFHAMTELLGSPRDDVVLATAPSTVDSLIWQYFWPLINGGKIIIANRQTLAQPAELLRLCETYGVTITDFVPTVFSHFLKHLRSKRNPKRYLVKLRAILIGGDRIDAQDVAEFKSLRPKVRIFNTYGPTEASIGSIFYEVAAGQRGHVPIGRPLPNISAYIVDAHLRPAPFEVSGELCLAGACLGRGYLNDEELTVQKFVQMETPGHTTERVYRTGDLARMGSDGLIYFLGRMDHQLKVNGQRIELGEIESALNGLPNIMSALVSPRIRNKKVVSLIAHIVFRDRAMAPSAQQLRYALLDILPPAMVPATYFLLDRIPVSANGKVDRQALLKEPGEPLHTVLPSSADKNEPHAWIETIVDEVWRKILERSRIPRESDFFLDLGADSLNAFQALLMMEERLGTELMLSSLYRYSSVRRLAVELSESRPQEATVSEVWAEELKIGLHRTLVSWTGTQIRSDAFLFTRNSKGLGQSLFWCCQSFNELKNLAAAVGEDFPVTGMRSGHLLMEYTPNNIALLGAWYAEEIAEKQPTGRLILGGNCQGAIIIEEAARQLSERHSRESELILLEHPNFKPSTGPLTIIFGKESHMNPENSDPGYALRFERESPGRYSFATIPGVHGTYFSPDTVGALARIIRRSLDSPENG